MTDDMMNLRALVEKTSDTDLLLVLNRTLIGHPCKAGLQRDDPPEAGIFGAAVRNFPPTAMMIVFACHRTSTAQPFSHFMAAGA